MRLIPPILAFLASVVLTSWLLTAPANAEAGLLAVAAAEPAIGRLAMPRYETTLYCQQVGIIGMTTSLTAWQGCANLERLAEQRLRARWTSVPAAHAGVCHRTAMFSGAGSYAVLEGCLTRIADRLAKAAKP